MADILSQEEIDQLLSSVSADDEPEAAVETLTVTKKKVSLYDFKRPDRVSKDQMRSIKNLHDKFARNFSSSLSGYLRSITDMNLISVDQMTYGEFLMSLPNPTSFNIISMLPLDGNAVLEVNPSLVFPIIDKLLGGQGEPIDEVREITDIEQNVIGGVLAIALRELAEVWQPIINIRFKIELRETSPHVIQIVSQNEVVILLVFEIKVGDVSGMMNICIPAIVLEPIMQKIDSQDWLIGAKKMHATANVQQITSIVSKSRTNLQAVLGESTMTLREILDLEIGDILTLSTKVRDPMVLQVGDMKKYYGEIGIIDNNKAFKIHRKIVKEDV
ncbi:flagellar motor switch protein FliM [Desulfurispirillum indicum]|uniref:Flagellar motor switch protein FliM n=1 Tax=Desulfurispirillum indicum (strain ATCC BAA-1389 / DSM 22839 / S5) TaxID=653733 RepID=E6W659_DESIS|nr:flagellar motor switch protein FliM [Desulfurispirillum indicum]ADU66095.1 flagellar motor switch protein FliM [Desulfurispirillum indicum S5]UCZ55501.1 flagellar motor switch protein FliM [Desulfurispirillum indicum]